MSATFKWLQYLFGQTGDRVAVPNAVQPDGSVSYSQGFGPDYERAASDPLAKNVPRAQSNQIYYDLCGNIQTWQVQTYPDFVPAASNGGVPVAYPYGATVKYTNGNIYVSKIDNNTTLPTSSSWFPMGGRFIKSTTMTASGIWTPDVATFQARVTIIGGGGAGGGAVATGAGALSVGTGGCAGAIAQLIVTPTGPVTVTIGAGGAGVNGGTGGTGGDTVFGGFCTAFGGIGGDFYGPTAAFPFVANKQSNNSIPAVVGAQNIFTSSGNLASSPAFMLSAASLYSGQGAGSQFGAGGGGQGVGVGGSGNGYGAGGGGSANVSSAAARAGGAGSGGLAIIEEFA